MAITDYEIIKEIGKGGMGIVYLARDPRLDRLVAIKKTKVSRDLSKEIHTEAVQRFYREARAIANLNHPNIVTIYELGEDKKDNECFMVMEYLEGESLEDIIKRSENKEIPLEVILKVGIHISEALSNMHKRNIIHRDIKPGNLMVCNNGMVKLTDFGLVQIDDSLDLTRVGTLLGSVLYMSLEQIKNPKEIDNRADIYSLGVSLYQALSGDFPFNGDSLWEVVTKITSQSPKPLGAANPKVPIALEKIIMKAISKDRDKRYLDITDFQNDLAEFNSNNTQAVLSPLNYAKVKKTTPLDPNMISNLTSSKKTEIKKDNLDKTVVGIESDFGNESDLDKTLIGVESDFGNDSDLDKTLIGVESDFKDDIEPIIPDFFDSNTDVDAIESTIKNCHKIIKININDDKKLYSDLKLLIEKYNSSLAQRQLIPKNNFDNLMKDLKKKISIKKLQRENKKLDKVFLQDKINAYQIILKSQIGRSSIIDFFVEAKENTKLGDSFVGGEESINIIADQQFENLKKIIINKLTNFEKIERFRTKCKTQIKFLKENKPEYSDNSNPIGTIIKLNERSKELDIRLKDDLDKNTIIEFDLSNKEVLFTYCNLIKDGKRVGKVRSGNTVTIKSDLFGNSMKDLFSFSTKIYKSKNRIVNFDLIEKEISTYQNYMDYLNSYDSFLFESIEKGFISIKNLINDFNFSNFSPETKKQAIVKSRKMKMALAEVKKGIENFNSSLPKELKNNSLNYINETTVLLNKFPAMIQKAEQESKKKKEKRKRIVQSIIMEIRKSSVDYTITRKNDLLEKINNLSTIDTPNSIQEVLKFYLKSKIGEPTGISKKDILVIVNKERGLLVTSEIDWVCRFLSFKYSRLKGFTLKY